MTTDQRKWKLAQVERVPFWWHTIDLGDGVFTPGQSSLEEQNQRAQGIPSSLEGKTVLDIGCWDGFYSFLCEQRGATVMAIDDFQHRDFVRSKYNTELTPGQGFRTAARCLKSSLKLNKGDFVRLKDAYDVVLFLGVLYHQRHPLLALEHVSRLTRECAVIETHYLSEEERPVLRFYPGTSLNQDPTNFWGPSLSSLDLMLKDVGFRSVDLISTWSGADDRALLMARK
jgi:tRNA (mo5U34)-methyltransferase